MPTNREREAKIIIRKYDIDFKAIDKISVEPYVYYFNLFSEKVLPFLMAIPRFDEWTELRLDADQKQQDELKRQMDLIAAQTISSFNISRLAQNLSKVFDNVKKKSILSYQKKLDKIIEVKANSKVMKESLGAARSMLLQQLANTAKGLDDITTRSKKQTAEDMVTKQIHELNNITNRVLSGVAAGERWESISNAVIGTTGKKNGEQIIKQAAGGDSAAAKIVNKARFIARNATSTVIGQYDKQLQTNSGIEFYVWQSAEDDRVRPAHMKLNGNVFAWNPGIEAPADISEGEKKYKKGQVIPQASDPGYNSGAPTIPGAPFNCRCVAIALIPGIDY